jgi:hypothetical protein
MTKDQNRELYLELIKKVLTDSLYQRGSENEIVSSRFFTKLLLKILRKFNLTLSQISNFDYHKRSLGKDWPKYGHTMIGIKRLNNIEFCLKQIIHDKVPGDLIETGVWRGGACIFMAAILKAYRITNKNIWVADSFQGLPKENIQKYPWDQNSPFYGIKNLNISLLEVKTNFKNYGLLSDQIKFLPGWFKDTLPQAPIKKLSLIRLDGDMYESTIDGLTYLYPKLSPQGFLIVDDFENIPACRQAVLDYRKNHQIKEKIIPIDKNGIYWQKLN